MEVMASLDQGCEVRLRRSRMAQGLARNYTLLLFGVALLVMGVAALFAPNDTRNLALVCLGAGVAVLAVALPLAVASTGAVHPTLVPSLQTRLDSSKKPFAITANLIRRQGGRELDELRLSIEELFQRTHAYRPLWVRLLGIPAVELRIRPGGPPGLSGAGFVRMMNERELRDLFESLFTEFGRRESAVRTGLDVPGVDDERPLGSWA
jgi:hypothetical protein